LQAVAVAVVLAQEWEKLLDHLKAVAVAVVQGLVIMAAFLVVLAILIQTAMAQMVEMVWESTAVLVDLVLVVVGLLVLELAPRTLVQVLVVSEQVPLARGA
jgi:protein-S-isoprenylcysteine O-methyltransferase Ste14